VAVDVDLNHDGKFDGPNERDYAVGTLGSDGTVQIQLGALEAGTYQLRARGSDKAGNEGISPTVTMQVSADPLSQTALNFEVNKGQTDSQAQFLARGRDYVIFLTASGPVLSLQTTMSAVTGSSPPAGAPTPPSGGTTQQPPAGSTQTPPAATPPN